MKALGLSPDERAAAFKDVTAASFGAGQIGAAVKNGILSGYPDGTFRGGQMVTRAEMSIMIAKGFKLASVSPGTKFTDIRPNMTGYAEINGLAAGKITEGYLDGTFRPYEKMSRATYAVFLAKAKNEKLK